MKKAVIFCNGKIDNYDFINIKKIKENVLICSDGGLRHINKLGLVPDVFVGDNDSWNGEYPHAKEIIKCPVEKDYTDTQKCIDYAISIGCNEIELYGGLGGRIDHEYSHFCLLSYGLKNGVKIKIIDEHNEIWMENKSFSLKKSDKRYVSFFPFGGSVFDFSVKGLKYTADNIILSCDEVQASSNEFLNKDAEITFKKGKVIVMLCDDVRCYDENK